MTTQRPKSISIGELHTAVTGALRTINVSPHPEGGPWPYIHPPIIVGIIIRPGTIDLNGAAEAIARQVSKDTGDKVTPIVQKEAGADAAQLLPGHVILGFRPDRPVTF